MANEVMMTEGLLACDWMPKHRQSTQPETGGASQVLIYGAPYWEVNLRYGGLTAYQFRNLTAQFMRLNGAAGLMEIWRLNRAHLATHKAEIPPELVQSFQVLTHYVRVVSNQGIVSPGDMIAYDTATGGRFVGEVTAWHSNSGVTSNFYTFPPHVPAAEQVNYTLNKAWGLFRQVPDTYNAVEPVGSGFGSLSVTMRQEVS